MLFQLLAFLCYDLIQCPLKLEETPLLDLTSIGLHLKAGKCAELSIKSYSASHLSSDHLHCCGVDLSSSSGISIIPTFCHVFISSLVLEAEKYEVDYILLDEGI